MYFWYIFRYNCELFRGFSSCFELFFLTWLVVQCSSLARFALIITEARPACVKWCGYLPAILRNYKRKFIFFRGILCKVASDLEINASRLTLLAAKTIACSRWLSTCANVFNLSTVHVSYIKYHFKLKQHENRRRFQAYTLPSTTATGSANAKLMTRWCVSAVPWTIFAESSVLSYSLMTVYWTARLFV